MMGPKTWGRLGLAVVAVAALAAGGCGSDSSGSGGGSNKMTIAYQPGIGYAELLIMKQQKTLEKALPDMKIAWRELSSGSAIRDGMLSGDIQVGSGGIGPFLVGYDAGVDWKLLTGLNQMDLWLMAKNPKFKTLADFKGNNKIAMPGPDSIQAIVLKKAAQEQLGDAKALDTNIVSLAHPDGLQSLVSGQIAGHLTAPRFQFDEQDEGARRIIGSYDVFGPHTFNSVFVRQGYYNNNKKAMDLLNKGVQDAAAMIKDDPAAAAKILSEESGGQESPADFKRYITEKSVSYSTEPKGFMAFAKFMKSIGLLKKEPGSAKDLVFPSITGPVS
jgi:NitT/TauT family transport system substrate-binding protein